MMKKKQVEKDRRKHERFNTNTGKKQISSNERPLEVELFNLDPGKTSVPRITILLDISQGGMLLSSEAPMTTGVSVLIRFVAPSTEEKHEIVGRVIRCEEYQTAKYRIGIAFMNIGKKVVIDLSTPPGKLS